MSEKIHGLIVLKSTSKVPSVGEKDYFSVINMPERPPNKKAYIKIKRDTKEYGGQLYSVAAITSTGRPPDMHGNVSFNIDITGPLAEDAAEAARGANTNNAQRDTLAERLAKAGKLLKWSRDMARHALGEEFTEEYARTLFISLDKAGYVSEVALDEDDYPEEDEQYLEIP